jgi:hypothetical protein
MDVESMLKEKVGSLITFLSSIQAIKDNERAFVYLSKFRDVEVIYDYCNQTMAQYDADSKLHLETLIVSCGLRPENFTTQELEKFALYMQCFMEVTKNCNALWEQRKKR